MDQSALLSYFCQKHDGAKEGCKLANPQAIYQNKVIFFACRKIYSWKFIGKEDLFHLLACLPHLSPAIGKRFDEKFTSHIFLSSVHNFDQCLSDSHKKSRVDFKMKNKFKVSNLARWRMNLFPFFFFLSVFPGVFKQQDLMKLSERGMEVYIRQALPETYRLVLR